MQAGEIDLYYFLEVEIRKLAETIFLTEYEGNIINNYELDINCEQLDVMTYKNIIKDLIGECFVNSKKRVDEQKNKLCISLWVDKSESQLLQINIKDNGVGVSGKKLEMLTSKGFAKTGGGLEMFNNLWEILFREKIHINSKDNEFFQVSFVVEKTK